jgi:hypothetical protein
VFPPEMIFPTAVAANDEHWGLANERIDDGGCPHAPLPG